MTTVGFHVNSVRQSPHGDRPALSLASRLTFGLGLGLRGGALLPLVQDKFDRVIVKVRIVTVLNMAAILSQESTAPFIGGARNLTTTFSRRGRTSTTASTVTGAGPRARFVQKLSLFGGDLLVLARA
eukprot:11899247-Heterocapsa_arctica.AAC.1